MAKKTEQTSVAVVKGIPKELVESLKPETREKLMQAIQAGKQVSVMNGMLVVHQKVEQPEITSWEIGEEVTGVIVSKKESSEYENNTLATIKTYPEGKLVVKPLNTVLKGMIDSFPEGSYLTIKCTGEEEGKKFTYKTFEVTFFEPLL